jgi:hypothetical protein
LSQETKRNTENNLKSSLTPKITWDIPRRIQQIARGAISNEQEAWKKIEPLERKATEAKNKVKGNEKEKAAQRKAINAQLKTKTTPFRRERERQQEKMKTLVLDLKTLQATCKTMPKIVVLDAWRIPLVTLNMELSVPGNRIDIGFIRRLGTMNQPNQ